MKKKPALYTEINITPLTDIFLVLLIIVMIVAPFWPKFSGEIQPPTITTGSTMDKKWLTIEIATDGAYALEGNAVAETELAQVLEARLPSAEEKTLVIRGDRHSKSRAAVRVMEAAQTAGFERVMIMGNERPGAPEDAASESLPREEAAP
ncbi:MAG: biopolymer transporter ExbD [Candidatus Hydrogenedentes bacterium]|nr:biopolymer transporter ExbD [Candidatus Hydrogenedentota bacterium]